MTFLGMVEVVTQTSVAQAPVRYGTKASSVSAGSDEVFLHNRDASSFPEAAFVVGDEVYGLVRSLFRADLEAAGPNSEPRWVTARNSSRGEVWNE